MNEDYYIEFFFKEVEVLMDSISENDHVAMLNHASLILSSIPDETKKRLPQTGKLLTKINKVLGYEPNMRILKLMQRVNREVETAVEYYSPPVGSDERLFYKQNLEKEMTMFENEIRKVIAEIIKDQTQSVLNI
jgi:hypothetical protein